MAVTEPRPAISPGVMDRARRALTVGLLLGMSAIAFEAMAVATVLPAATGDLGGLGLYGWAFSAFMLANLVSTIVASQIADRRGPAAPYVAGMVLFGCGLTLAGLAPAMPVFIAGRTLQGAGAGAIAAINYVSISRGYPDALRARMMAALSTAWVVPALVGPAVAGIVADRLSWRLVFLGLLPLLLLAVALMLPALRRMAPAVASDDDSGRVGLALRLAAGAGLVLTGISLRAPLVAVALVAAGIALALPAFRGLMPAGALTLRPGLPAGIAVRGLLNFGFFGAESFLPLGLTSLRGLSTGQAGIALTASALTWTAGSWTQARLDARDGGRGRQARVMSGFVLLVAGGVVTALAVITPAVPVAAAIGGWAAAGLGMGLAYPTLSLIILRLAPPGREGAVSGSMQVAEVLSIAVAAGLGGAAISLGEGLGWAPRVGIAAAFGFALAGSLLGLLATRRLTAATPAAPSGIAARPTA